MKRTRKIKEMIEKAEAVVRIWEETTMIMDPELETSIPELKEAIKRVKGENG